MKLCITLLSFCIFGIGEYLYSSEDLSLLSFEGQYRYELNSKGIENSGSLTIERKDDSENILVVRGMTKISEKVYTFSFNISIDDKHVAFDAVNIPDNPQIKEFKKCMVGLVFNGLIPKSLKNLNDQKENSEIDLLHEKYARISFNPIEVKNKLNDTIVLEIKARDLRPADIGQKHGALLEKSIVFKKDKDIYVLYSSMVNYTSYPVPDNDPDPNFLEEGKHQIKLTRVSNSDRKNE